MGKVVGLGAARKAKACAEKEAQAAANRAMFGRTRAERAAEDMDAARRAALLDRAKRD